MFGADLTEEISRTHGEAPAVVIKCVEEIEKACSDHGMFKIAKPTKWYITVNVEKSLKISPIWFQLKYRYCMF